MKSTFQLTLLSAALLPAMAVTAIAADDKPRPAQESRGGTTTGTAATETSTEAPVRAVTPSDRENPNLTPRPAQQSRGGTTTGAAAIEPSRTATDAAKVTMREEQEKREKEAKDAERERAARDASASATDTRNPVAPAGGTGKGPGGESAASPAR